MFPFITQSQVSRRSGGLLPCKPCDVLEGKHIPQRDRLKFLQLPRLTFRHDNGRSTSLILLKTMWPGVQKKSEQKVSPPFPRDKDGQMLRQHLFIMTLFHISRVLPSESVSNFYVRLPVHYTQSLQLKFVHRCAFVRLASHFNKLLKQQINSLVLGIYLIVSL